MKNYVIRFKDGKSIIIQADDWCGGNDHVTFSINKSRNVACFELDTIAGFYELTFSMKYDE